jgi:predicted Zn-dependent peptidase
MHHNQTTLPNGLRIITVEMPHIHSAEITIYLKVGARCDPPGKAGLAHFMEHMLFRGTRAYPTTLELETAFEVIGGNVNAATDAETTCFYSRVHPDRIAEGLTLFASMLLEPTFQGIDIEKRIITEEALEDINEEGAEINPENVASRLLWPDTPLAMPTVGTIETIAGFTEEDLRQQMATWYVPTNAVIAVAGNVTVQCVVAAVENAFGAWQGTPPPSVERISVTQTCARSSFVKNPDSQIDLQIAFRGFARQDPRIMPTRILRRLMAGTGSSRLHLLLREALGIVYSVDATISAFEETGAFAIDLSTAPDNFHQAIGEVLAECRKIASEPVPSAELKRVKRAYLYDLEFSMDSAYELANRFGWGELAGMLKTIDEERGEVEKVTAEDIRSAAQAIFAPINLNLVAIGPLTPRQYNTAEALMKEHSDSWGTVKH